MKQLLRTACLVILSVQVLLAAPKKKVACIGDSVTKGAGLHAGQSYPALLGQYLGKEYLVENFGRNGATLLYKGHNPYSKSPEYQAALEYNPDILIISLGLNDTDPRNWPNFKLEFQQDYAALIAAFKKRNPDLRILICQLTPIFSGHSRFLSGTRDWYAEIQQEIRHVAQQNAVELIDNHKPLAKRIDLFDDYLHPNEEGMLLIAKHISNHLTVNIQPLSVSETIGSHMVLQRGVVNQIQGLASSGTPVQMLLNGKQYSSTADLFGKWEIGLPAFPAGGPYEVSIYAGLDSIILADIYFGDVYLASGQSNMAFPTKEAYNKQNLLDTEAQKYPIRLFKNKNLVETNSISWDLASLAKINRLEYFKGSWSLASSAEVANFSAIAYSFALEINRSANVPIGIIELSVGGSNIESWIPRTTLEQDNLLASYIHTWRSSDFVQEFCRQRALLNLQQATQKNQRHPYDPAFNFEAGLSKWTSTKIKAFLWYQGESNAHNVEHHAYLFKHLVKSWRTAFQDEVPFYFVQLSSLNRPSWPSFRDSQRMLLSQLPQIYMAISSDLGDSTDVHPKEKIPIGKRLADLVKRHSYGRKIQADSPQPIAIQLKNDHAILLSFNNNKFLKTKAELAVVGFQGIDYKGNIIEIQDVLIKKNKLLIKTSRPIQRLMYGYEPYTRANLENEHHVPVSTFSLIVKK